MKNLNEINSDFAGVLCVLSVMLYWVLWIFAQFAAGEGGNAETVGKIVGVANVGQVFTKECVLHRADPHVR